ncbi:MAG: glycoside hydrolase family 97 catalytic domain-containing protein [Verrucomicrobiota bacterium]
MSRAEEVLTRSPDKTITFHLAHSEKSLVGRLAKERREIITGIPISITIDGVEYPGTFKVKSSEQKHIRNSVTPIVPTIKDLIEEACTETLVQFDCPVALRIRVYDDGVAFRWESQFEKDEVTVNSERLSFTFAEDYPVYYPIHKGEGFFSHQENYFKHSVLSQTKDLITACVPLLVELGRKQNLLLTDVNVEEYPGLWIKGGEKTELTASFPHHPAKLDLKDDRNLTVLEYNSFLAKTAGTRSYPWRALLITDDAGLLTSTMLYTLADPCRLNDTSWIKPGKAAWDWWNAWNITDVPFEAGINQATYKNYIDFASANKLPYVILDEGWSVVGPAKLLDVIPALNIRKLVEYGKAKNVGIILWMTSTALERNFDAAFKQFSKWGIKGIKVDFMQRDDQVMMDFCARIAERAAQHKLIVNFHGGSKPTGLQRTYPNVLTHESVLGLEQSKWSKSANPDMAVLVPFIRMAVGPMDYTPGAMDNYSEAEFLAKHEDPGSLGTRCHQLAMYVAYLSPLQMLADTPTKYRKNPECMPFLQEVPTTWNETVVLKAEIGNVLALARRNGNRWFICAMTDWIPRELSCKLDFLPKGKYRLRFWSDGPNAAKKATDTSIGESTATNESELKLRLAPGGGYVAIVEPYSTDSVKE